MSRGRRKIRLDKGDTLGGTVSLLLRDDVSTTSGGGPTRLNARKPARPFLRMLVFSIVLFVALIGWFALFPDFASAIGIPPLAETWDAIAARIESLLP